MKSESPETIVTEAPEKSSADKIAYIDHLKVLLTVLVILHHAFITYGAPGGWYYQQKTTTMAALFPMAILVATNQSFFMGFFFFLSALFVEPSYQKKGAARFLADRLKRLGVPLIFYSLVLSPVLNYIVEHYGYGSHHSFVEYISGYRHWIDFGVMWFVAALLIFNFIYLLFKNIPFSMKLNLPSTRQLLLIGVLLGLFTFLTRLIFPTGWTLFPLGFQLGYFPQYILLFITGLIASKNNWLGQLNIKQGKYMAFMARLMVLVILPVLFILYLWLKFPGNYFNGGWNILAFSYSLWEQLTGIMIMTALLSIAKFKWNTSTVFLRKLSVNAFGAYIFHPIVLITLSLLVQGWHVDPAVKLIAVAPVAIVFTFLLVSLIRKIPFVKSII
jgi:Acyltransferase family